MSKLQIQVQHIAIHKLDSLTQTNSAELIGAKITIDSWTWLSLHNSRFFSKRAKQMKETVRGKVRNEEKGVHSFALMLAISFVHSVCLESN